MGVKHADSVYAEIKLRGKWWLPQSPEHKIDGTLKGSEARGFRLSTAGSLIQNESSNAMAAAMASALSLRVVGPHPLIYGNTLDGFVTLCETFELNQQASSSGISRVKYNPALVLVGGHLNDGSTLQFSSVRAKYSVLCDWVDERVFKPNLGGNLQTFDVAFAFPPKHYYSTARISRSPSASRLHRQGFGLDKTVSSWSGSRNL